MHIRKITTWLVQCFQLFISKAFWIVYLHAHLFTNNTFFSTRETFYHSFCCCNLRKPKRLTCTRKMKKPAGWKHVDWIGCKRSRYVKTKKANFVPTSIIMITTGHILELHCVWYLHHFPLKFNFSFFCFALAFTNFLVC